MGIIELNIGIMIPTRMANKQAFKLGTGLNEPVSYSLKMKV